MSSVFDPPTIPPTAQSDLLLGATPAPSPTQEQARDQVEVPAVRESLLSAFATPVSNFKWPDSDELNTELKAYILELEQRSQGVIKSNIGGWHSHDDLFQHDHDAIAALRERVCAYLESLSSTIAEPTQGNQQIQYGVDAWANILRNGEYNSLHSHPNAFWSGVYYVTGNTKPADDNQFSGRLELLDPRPGASLSYPLRTRLYGRFLVDPTPGQMVVFPGWLQHQVHPYFGNEQRISIAFNMMIRTPSNSPA